MTTTALSIDSQFDGGAINVLSCARADDIRLRIRPDSHSDFCQWFYFSLNGARATPCALVFENAGESSMPDWKDYQAFASYDQQQWFRVPTHFDGCQLRIEHTPEFDRVYYAYFEPYSEARHHTLLGALQQCPKVALVTLGKTVQQRPMTMVKVGTEHAGKKRIWIIARQHPGETMGQWFVEGLLARLTGQQLWAGDPVRHPLLERAVFYIVPNMNPDGSVLGNLRTNAAGANLNREWKAPDAQRSPEVVCVRKAIHETGCDLFFDIHGEEQLPYIFPVQHQLKSTREQQHAYETFIRSFKQFGPDLQTEHGYSMDYFPDDEKPTFASEYVGAALNCFSMALEMPFKDNANLPDAKRGWCGARSAALGAGMLAAIQQHLTQHI